jgi:hypothetical protein
VFALVVVLPPLVQLVEFVQLSEPLPVEVVPLAGVAGVAGVAVVTIGEHADVGSNVLHAVVLVLVVAGIVSIARNTSDRFCGDATTTN